MRPLLYLKYQMDLSSSQAFRMADCNLCVCACVCVLNVILISYDGENNFSKLNVELPYDPAIQSLEIPRRTESRISKLIRTPLKRYCAQ